MHHRFNGLRRLASIVAIGAAGFFAAPCNASFVYSDLLIFRPLGLFDVDPAVLALEGMIQGEFLQTGYFNFTMPDGSALPFDLVVANLQGPGPDPTVPDWGSLVAVAQAGGPYFDQGPLLETFILNSGGLGSFSHDFQTWGLIGDALVALPVEMTIDVHQPRFGTANEMAVSLRVIPEPATLGLIGSAMLAMAWSMRRTNRAGIRPTRRS